MVEIKARAWNDGVMANVRSILMLHGIVQSVEVFVSGGKTEVWSIFDSVEFYTGVQDKDNVEIYEGDIVVDETGYVAEIYFSKILFAWCTINAQGERLYLNEVAWIFEDGKCSTVKRIGNIHDNPEMMRQ